MAKLSSDKTYVTVEKGDTLYAIANRYGTTVSKLAAINDIDDPNYIVIGQKIKLTGAETKKPVTDTTKVTIKVFGLQSNTDRTLYARYDWTKWSTTDYVETWWYYDTGDGMWFIADQYKDEYEQGVALYTAPSNAKRVMFKVKPVAKTRTVNGKETAYWTAQWSTFQFYDFSDNPPTVPSVPTVTIDNYKLTAYLNNLDELATEVKFEIRSTWDVDGGSTRDAAVIVTAKVYDRQATGVQTIEAGKSYRVRAKTVNPNGESEWTDYSDSMHSIPTPPKEIIELKALSETSIYVEWSNVSIATQYTVEYTTDKTYFDSSPANVKSVTVESNVTHTEITGLTSGDEYFFRVKAINAGGDSVWTDIKSIIIGKDPAAPTTWSSTTTAVTGEPIIFYWVHNAEDGSSQTYAELELTIGGTIETLTIKNSEDEEEKDRTSSYTFETAGLTEGSEILWRVRTSGITGVYGDWSIQRTVTINAPAVLTLSVTDIKGNAISVLTSYPFYVHGIAGPFTQRAVGYSVTVVSQESYETVDEIGNVKMVSAGEQIYSRYFDTDTDLLVEMSAGNISLENNIIYTVRCTVAMSSGLTATDSVPFRVAWAEETYIPNAEIGVDKDNVSVYIRPYCEYYPEGSYKLELVDGVTLAVYRKEFDGSFTEIASGLENTNKAFVTDPHPALDYARYRIVATTKATGAVSYYDIPGYPIGETAVIIQWAEEWTNYTVDDEKELYQPAWSGSLLRLPYNIDTSESYDTDVSLIKYAGRKHPVTYYGTQLGTTPTWNMDIVKEDVETIYALRRLAAWPGDVYVREPSGTGYWAHVKVSFSQKHTALTIPVTLNITRVEGGV